MATITTDTYFDDAARTAGEAWTITDCTLTIRTDTRVYNGAPASMTGTLGAMTCAGAFGRIFIDGTKVRWLAYTSGTGTVPATGITVTKGAVSGYMLGVWSTVNGAPTAAGAAMPATGFIKFREVIGGAFSSGALTGISATASGADVVGWIEVVMDHGAKLTMSPKGEFTALGDWFYLGTTNGTRAQILLTPYNGAGGGSNGAISGAQIETSPGSNVYEWYPCATSASYAVTNVGTDDRGKVIQVSTTGVQICATSVGKLPASGCKVRIPNIFMRQCTTAARGTNSTNTIQTSRPSWNTAKYGDISLTRVMSDWNNNFPNFGKVTLQDCAFEQTVVIRQASKEVVLSNSVISNIALVSGTGIDISLCNVSVNVDTVISYRNNTGAGLIIAKCNNVTATNWVAHQGMPPSSSSGSMATFSYCINSSISNYTTIGGGVAISDCTNFTSSGHNFCYSSTSTTTSNQLYLLSATRGSNVTYQNVTIGYGTVANTHPDAALFQTLGTTGLKIRNIGTQAAPLNTGSVTKTASIWSPSSNPDNGIKFGRIFATDVPTSSSVTTSAFSLDAPQITNVGSYTTPWIASGLTNTTFKGVQGTTIGSTWTYAPGTHCGDVFTSATAGALICNLGLPTATSLASQFTTSITTTPYSGFDDTGVALVTVGDSLIYEMPYLILGHTAFQNVDPTFASTTNIANHDVAFDIDTGSGYTGSWTTLNGANLSALTIAATGFRIKFKFVCNTASNANKIGKFTILTTSTATAQANNLYPLDTNTFGFTGLQPGSEVRAYVGTNPVTATEIGGTESTSGSTFSFTHSSGGQAGVIAIFAMGYQPIYLPYTYPSSDTSLLIQQVIDRNYANA